MALIYGGSTICPTAGRSGQSAATSGIDFLAQASGGGITETWIPYHLDHAADVVLTIYDIKGAVVRRLELGHQNAGYYTDRNRAAHWDGYNNLGESVGSGLYLYTLTVGDFSTTRKMLLLK